jgi:hypothetical protein
MIAIASIYFHICLANDNDFAGYKFNSVKAAPTFFDQNNQHASAQCTQFALCSSDLFHLTLTFPFAAERSVMHIKFVDRGQLQEAELCNSVR